MSSKGIMRKFCRVGPGGWKCACCAPPPGSRDRRILMRRAKKQAAREDFALQEKPNQAE